MIIPQVRIFNSVKFGGLLSHLPLLFFAGYTRAVVPQKGINISFALLIFFLYISYVQTIKDRKMQSIAVSELRANLMSILKNIEKGTSMSITSRGKVVAKLIPPEESLKLAELKLAEIRKSAKVHDVLSPISTKWKADS